MLIALMNGWPCGQMCSMLPLLMVELFVCCGGMGLEKRKGPIGGSA